MKKKIYIIAILAFLIVGLIYLLHPIPNYKCPPPTRPINVPDSAKWCGDCDGGDWIYLVSDSNNFHFIVYNDYSGEIRIDGIFQPNNNKLISLNEDNWKDQVLYYMNDPDGSLKIIIHDSISISVLICKYPPNAGSDWDIIKEKKE